LVTLVTLEIEGAAGTLASGQDRAGQTGALFLSPHSRPEHTVVKNGTGGNALNLSIGRIDAYHRDVENLVNRRCMGVGTRYLMNYFGWARRITLHKPFGNDLSRELLAA